MSIQFASAHKKALFFDVNETLVMPQSSFEDSFKATWHEYAARWSDDDEDFGAEPIYQSYRTAWLARGKMSRPGSGKHELQEKALREALAHIGVPVHRTFAQDFFEHVKRKQQNAKTLYPGVMETLSALHPRYTLALISNSRAEDVDTVVRKLHLTEFFPAERRFSARSINEKKPNPHLFHVAMKSLRLSPRDCVMIGNSYRHDVLGAWKAGIDAIWVQRSTVSKKNTPQTRGRRQPVVIKQINQLLDLLT